MQDYRPTLPSLPQGSDGFRILELLPGSNTSSGEIRGNFHQARLSDHPDYEALSYCWGDPTKRHIVQIDGKPYPVTDSLYFSLHHLRRQDQSRYLWIDAICINQHDFDERSQQVGLMRNIYNEAQHVVAWLGPEADNSLMGMILAEKLVKAYHQRKSTGDPRMYQHLQDMGINAVYDLPEYRSGNHFRAFFQIFNRPWFERGWVIQEVATAKNVTVQCGNSVLRFEDLMLCLIFINEMGITPLTGKANLMRLMRMAMTRQAFQGGQVQSLLMLLTRHSDARTTDPRDRVYALNGMALDTTVHQTTDNGPGLGIKADYRANVEDVYRSVTVKMITKLGSLDVLFTPRDPNSVSDLLLPSWVPDFSLSYQQFFLLSDPSSKVMAAGASRCHPSFNTVHDTSCNRTQHLLGVSGMIFDTVVALSDYWPFESFESEDDNNESSLTSQLLSASRTSLEDRRRYIRAHEVAGLSPLPWTVRPQRYVTSQPLEEALWAACTAGRQSSKSSSYESWRQTFRRYGLLRLLPCSPLQHLFLIIGMALEALGLGLCLCCCLCCIPGFFRRKKGGDWMGLMTGLGGRRILRTRMGWIGVAGGKVTVGDRVAVLEGGRLVAVLRDTGNALSEEGSQIRAQGEAGGEQALWTLVGDAYVHGVMDGNFFKRERCGRIWLR